MTMHTYIVTYDICESGRLRAVYQNLRSWGNHLQYSVFMVQLNAADLARLRRDLSEMIHHGEDQVLLFNLGPAAGRARESVEALGLAYTHPERSVLVF
jgi:CRISPR-associated protein Cas2